MAAFSSAGTLASFSNIAAESITLNSCVPAWLTQIDLPSGQQSGLKNAIEILSDVDGVVFTYFTPGDVVRHQLVQRIVEAYEADGNGKNG